MSEAEIKLDRYAKFRKLGMFQEYVVKGGDWRGAAAERSAVSGRVHGVQRRFPKRYNEWSLRCAFPSTQLPAMQAACTTPMPPAATVGDVGVVQAARTSGSRVEWKGQGGIHLVC